MKARTANISRWATPALVVTAEGARVLVARLRALAAGLQALVAWLQPSAVRAARSAKGVAVGPEAPRAKLVAKALSVSARPGRSNVVVCNLENVMPTAFGGTGEPRAPSVVVPRAESARAAARLQLRSAKAYSPRSAIRMATGKTKARRVRPCARAVLASPVRPARSAATGFNPRPATLAVRGRTRAVRVPTFAVRRPADAAASAPPLRGNAVRSSLSSATPMALGRMRAVRAP